LFSEGYRIGVGEEVAKTITKLKSQWGMGN
jgi:hypothetical protein